jgi:hypothetical protein
MTWLLPPLLLADVVADLLGGAGKDALRVADDPGQKLVFLVGATIVALGVGCLLAVLRVIFPAPTARADRVVGGLGTGRLLLTGILPIFAIALLGQAAGAGGQATQVAFALVLFVPAIGLTILGAMALVPHLGGRLLGKGDERSPLLRSVVGSVVLVLALAASLLFGEGGLFLFGLLILGWFFSAGLGATLRPRSPQPDPDPVDLGEPRE